MFAKVHQTLSTVNTNLFGASEIFERKDIKRAMQKIVLKLQLVCDNLGQTYSDFDHHFWKYCFWANLVSEFKVF